jgi:purine-binding chemotaxis protein CheW
MRPLPIRPLAAASPSVLGVAILRGRPTPVLDVAQLVTGAASAAITRFVCVRVDSSAKQERIVALAVDEVLAATRLSDAQLGALPPLIGQAQQEIVAAVGRFDLELMVVLKTAHLLTDDAWTQIAHQDAHE